MEMPFLPLPVGACFSMVLRWESLFSLTSEEGRTSDTPLLMATTVRCLPVAAEVRTTENPGQSNTVNAIQYRAIQRRGVLGVLSL